MYEGWDYERLRAEAESLRLSMLEIDTKLSARNLSSDGQLALGAREYAQWRKRAVFAKQTKTAQLLEVKALLKQLTPPLTPGTHSRQFWRSMCRSMVGLAEAVRRCDEAPPDLRHRAEGALSDLALALATVPEDAE